MSVASRHHVLLIGIDAYDGGGSLTGCVNDIDAVQRLLVDRAAVPRDCITRLAAPRTGTNHESDVPSELPTLDRMRAAFVHLGTNAVGPEDHVFIYYSGHGTQCVVVDPKGRRYTREALLPKDKVQGVERRFLIDWELNCLLARIAQRTRTVTMVLDCCSSSGATRAVDNIEGAQDRFQTTPQEFSLPLDGTPLTDADWGLTAAIRDNRCQLIAACRDDERAREAPDESGLTHGELTRALVAKLNSLDAAELPHLRWGRIWRAIDAQVRQSNPQQSPWLGGSFGRLVVGLGPDQAMDPGLQIKVSENRYFLDVGTLCGITKGAEVAVYGPTPATFPLRGTPDDLAARQGLLKVCRADQSTSEAVAVTPFALPAAARGRLVKAGPSARLRVSVLPSIEAFLTTIAESPLVEIVSGGDADLSLVRRFDGTWALCDNVFGTGVDEGGPLLAAIPNSPTLARSCVEHYNSYVTPLRMARACRDLPNLLRMWLLDCNDREVSAEEAQAPDLPRVATGNHAPYEVVVGDRLCIAVENCSDLALSVTLLCSATSGRVSILGEKRVVARSQHVFWFNDVLGNPFLASLPPGQSVGIDRIVAIGTPRRDLSLGFLRLRGSFGEILEGSFRDASTPNSITQSADSWTAAQTALRIARPSH